MKTMYIRWLGGYFILILCICVGFWLYIQWDVERFNKSLPKPPAAPAQEVPRSVAPVEELQLPPEDTAIQELNVETPTVSESSDSHLTDVRDSEDFPTLDDESTLSSNTENDNPFEAFFEEPEALSSGGFTDTAEEMSYDISVVRAGFDDYNTSLASNPEYAYQRLDDALREQYGDDPDVDILIEHTRRMNDGTATIDSIIENIEAQQRLTVKNNYPGEDTILEALEYYREIRQAALEEGARIKITGSVRID